MEKNKELVSVIIPIYNVEKYLKQCIESIINQTYKNIYIILIDDGSTDESKKIMEEFEKKEKRISSYYQDNKGAPAARNLGIENSKGKYIMLFDSDDILEKSAIEKMVNIIERDKSDLVIGNFVRVDNENKKIIKINHEWDDEKIIEENIRYNALVLNPLPGNKLFRAQTIKQNKIRFDNVKIAQDLNFYLKFVMVCHRITLINDMIFRYRLSNNGISRQKNFRMFDIVNSLEKVEKFANDLNMNEDYKNMLDIVKIMHYEIQQTKIRKFDKKIDRNIVFLYFKKYISEIDLTNNKYKQKYKKMLNRIKLKNFLKGLYISNLYVNYKRKKLNEI